MAMNNTLRPTTSPTAATQSQTVGDSATAGTASDAVTTNPIGTGTAKLLSGDTQEEDNALQLLKYDAYGVTIAQTKLTALQSGGGSATDIAAAQKDLATTRSTYEQDLTTGTSGYSLTGSRVNRYLTGGDHPVPDNALIPSADQDLTAFMKGLTDADAADATAASSSAAATGSSTASKDTGTGTVSNVDTSLSAAMQTHLATSSDVLATSTITDPSSSTDAAVTSGDLSSSFTLYPSGAPSVADVNQNLTNDCYYMSALSSMASQPAGQKTIQDAIGGPAANGDYTVTMHSPSGALVDIAVNPNNLPVTSDGSPATNSSSGNAKGANWVNLMEAAYAKYNDAYGTNTASAGSGATGFDGIDEDGKTDTSFNLALTGKSSTSTAMSDLTATDVASKMQTSLSAGLPVEAYNLDTASTTTASGVALVPSHAYAVVGVSADGQTVTMRNPWGDLYPEQTKGENADGTFTMSIDDFKNSFEQVNT